MEVKPFHHPSPQIFPYSLLRHQVLSCYQHFPPFWLLPKHYTLHQIGLQLYILLFLVAWLLVVKHIELNLKVLKTPLVPILGYCGVLLNPKFGQLSADQKEAITEIQQNSV